MTLGGMQPYLFPYLGYFQLMGCVDTYLFCGEFQYIRHGWINRNRIFAGHEKYFTFSVAKDDCTKNINQRRYSNLQEDCERLKRSLLQNYRNAVNFEEAYGVIEDVVKFQDDNVARFNVNANIAIARYLGIGTRFIYVDTIEDDELWDNFHRLDYESRIIYLCGYFGADHYVNAIGGRDLYHAKAFADSHVELGFLKTDDIVYPQPGKEFVPNLSIIDVIMNNKVDAVKTLLKKYQVMKPGVAGD